ncbi:nitrilase family protein [Nonlabens spongiae]|uniref:Omega-amidase YafV n=1 Tax=Nonlabens spongiae TaxID=331648 RepID=A0A1W6MLJ3_9FLAO|nr:nitrilase family protein [Nonlabens spongiae]ARN78437.1 nitrilase family protein [Nonlabens spongiae]
MKGKNELRVSLIQTSLEWENPQANLAAFSDKFKQLKGKTDLVIIPEMFTTGFSMKPQGIASDEKIYTYLKTRAAEGNFAIYGSSMLKKSDGSFVNRGLFATPEGDLFIYDKRHTFTLAGEQKVYDKGGKPVMAEYLGWKFNLQICYDLRFPVYARNTQDYDVVIYVANWPVLRVNAWDALLKARAIENMAYSIGVNRVGTDGTGMNYNGHSQVYNILGKEMIDHPWETDGVKTVILKKSEIEKYREKLRFLGDRDAFTLDL